MHNKILNLLEDPVELEKLYRSNSSTFKETFLLLYPEIQDEKLAQFHGVKKVIGFLLLLRLFWQV
jgi:hypothetical protein